MAQQWEYAVLRVYDKPALTNIISVIEASPNLPRVPEDTDLYQYLNLLGKAGWELTGSLGTESLATYQLFFKRALP